MQAALAVLILGLGACGGRASAPAPELGNRAAPAPGAPVAACASAEVDALVERWVMCAHWAGEEPYDAERRADIQRGIDESCPGNAEAKAGLERRCADAPDVLARLRDLVE